MSKIFFILGPYIIFFFFGVKFSLPSSLMLEHNNEREYSLNDKFLELEEKKKFPPKQTKTWDEFRVSRKKTEGRI